MSDGQIGLFVSSGRKQPGPAVTWENIEGLTDAERKAGRSLIGGNGLDLRIITLRSNIHEGVRIPDIVQGVVVR